MEKLLNNSFLKKIQEFAQKIGSNGFIMSLSAGMMSSLSIIMVGAFCQIFAAMGSTLGLFEADGTIYNAIYAPYNYTMGLLSLWMVPMIAFNYARNLRLKSPMATAIATLCVFALATASYNADGTLSTTYFGSVGLFSGFIIVFVVCRMEKLCMDKNIKISLPDVCPKHLISSFNAIIPLAFCVIIFQGLNSVLGAISGGQLCFPSLIMALFMAPLSGLINSTLGIFVICFIACLLWCFGVHGGGITYPLIMTYLFTAVETNAALHAAGQPLQYFPALLYGAMASLGGTGCIFPLAFYSSFLAKSKQMRAVGKAGFIPNCFSITEPLIFGMPVVFNPILSIPFVLVPMMTMGLFYLGYKMGWISPSWIMMFGILPISVGDYFSTLDIRNVIYTWACMIPAFIVWYPFCKLYDNQLLAKEKEEEAALAK